MGTRFFLLRVISLSKGSLLYCAIQLPDLLLAIACFNVCVIADFSSPPAPPPRSLAVNPGDLPTSFYFLRIARIHAFFFRAVFPAIVQVLPFVITIVLFHCMKKKMKNSKISHFVLPSYSHHKLSSYVPTLLVIYTVHIYMLSELSALH